MSQLTLCEFADRADRLCFESECHKILGVFILDWTKHNVNRG